MFTSCLHINNRFVDPVDPRKSRTPEGISARLKARLFLSNLLKIRFHSGSYPRTDRGLLQHAERYFDVVSVLDRTEDYRLTAVLDPEHFQAPKFQWTLKKALKTAHLALVDPFHLHKWLDLKFDAWMNFYGKDPYDPTYNPEKRRETSAMLLYWHVLSLREGALDNAT